MRFVSGFILASLLAASSALAQSDDGQLRAQLRQVTLQLRQVQDDQATLQAQKGAAEQERDALKKQLAAAQAELAHSHRVVVDTSGPVRVELAQTKGALTKASESASQFAAERDKLKETVAFARTLLDACDAKNALSLKVGHEILDAYQRFDFGDAIGANEPFVGTERVKLENMAQSFGDKLDDGHFDPRQVKRPDAKSDQPKSDVPKSQAPPAEKKS